MAEYISIRGKRIKMSAAEEAEFLSERAAAVAAAATRTQHKAELLVGATKRVMALRYHNNLTAAEITAMEAAGYTVTEI